MQWDSVQFLSSCDCTVSGESQRASPLRDVLLYSVDVVTIVVGALVPGDMQEVFFRLAKALVHDWVRHLRTP